MTQRELLEHFAFLKKKALLQSYEEMTRPLPREPLPSSYAPRNFYPQVEYTAWDFD
jgi:hypothetical protein